MTLRLWTEESVDAADYSAYVEMVRHATPFHAPGWLRVLDEGGRGGMHILRVSEGAETIALFPHLHARKGPVSFLASPPPEAGVQYLGPLFPGLEDLKQDKRERRLTRFADALLDHVRETKVRYLQVRMAPGLDDARPFLWAGFSVSPRYTYQIDLHDGVEAIWERLKKSVRSDIRRTEGGITIEWNREADFDAGQLDVLIR